MKKILLTLLTVSVLICMLAVFPAILGADTPTFSQGTLTPVNEDCYTIASDDFSAFISTRLSDKAGRNDLRIILAANLEKLTANADAEMTIRFLDGDGNAVKTLSQSVVKDLLVYASATAAGKTYTASEGSVLFGIVINAVPNDAWDTIEVSLATAKGKLASGSREAATIITPDVTEPTAPETTVPETTVPETTVPETTVPETEAPQEPVTPVMTGSNWMSFLKNSTSLCKIAMPGTHDSGATTGGDVAECQDLTITQQLEAGVRYFDIRLRRVNGALHLYHGMIDQKLTFEEVLNACYSFLEKNPSEALIMCIKEEYDASGTNDAFDTMVKKHIDAASDKWYTKADIPRLNNVRGKIVLMRRYTTSGTFGFNASSGWTDNSASFTISNGTTWLKVQDYYENSSADDKWTAIENFFATMKSADNTYYLNNTSGYKPGIKFFDQAIPDIKTIFNGVYPKLITYLKTNPDIVGIVATDFMNAEIAGLIYGLNFS